jgi:hypothetical protein
MDLEVVARVDQALESEGAFLVTVRAHSLWLETAPGPDVTGDGEPDWTLKREGGQLLLLRLPSE